jgi:hypothetical protein
MSMSASAPEAPEKPAPATSTEAAEAAPSKATAEAAASAAPAAGALSLTQGRLPDATKALSAAEGLVRGCFQKAKTPPKSGSLTIKVTVATSGFSLNVTVKEAGDVDKATASCAKAALRDASWGKPEGGGVAAVAGVVQVP